MPVRSLMSSRMGWLWFAVKNSQDHSSVC
jgi:hypothetical protein